MAGGGSAPAVGVGVGVGGGPPTSAPTGVRYLLAAYDLSTEHFTRCKQAPNCFAIIDLVSRKWIDTLLSAEETSIQVEVEFTAALEGEGLMAKGRGPPGGHHQHAPSTPTTWPGPSCWRCRTTARR